MAQISHFKVGNMILPENKIMGYEMYLEAYKELHDICKAYGAVVDFSTPYKVFVMNTTKGCRKSIRRLYGSRVQIGKIGKTIQLGGLQ